MYKFDPQNRITSNLAVLRQAGFKRQRYFGTQNQTVSPCLRALLPFINKIENGVYIDGGCGDAPEVFYMAKRGWRSFGIDCFSPTHTETLEHYKNTGGSFVEADISEAWVEFWDKKIKTEKCDAITLNAMIDLIPESQWVSVFYEVYECLEYGVGIGYFAVNFVDLKSAGVNTATKKEDLLRAVEEVCFPLVGISKIGGVVIACSEYTEESLKFFKSQTTYFSIAYWCPRCELQFRQSSSRFTHPNHCHYCGSSEIGPI